MNESEALTDLTNRLEARLAGVALVHVADGPVRIPAETAAALARTALDWARQNGLQLETS